MEVLNARSALLSNFEVLTLLKELESDHLARTRTALRIKKEEEAAGLPPSHSAQEEVLENLRTVEVEAIQYLSADYQPTASQSEAGITQLTRSLAQYNLTKAEKLQVVNLAPTEPVELYVIVEELEDRFAQQIDEILDTVRASLRDVPVPPAEPVEGQGDDDAAGEVVNPSDTMVYEEQTWEEYEAVQDAFDDTGEGVGIEGDLDVDDD